MRRKLNLGLVSAIVAAILAGSLSPGMPSGSLGPLKLSYLLHFTAYFLLASALLLYFHDTRQGIRESVLVASLIGLCIELIQSQLSYRTFSVLDVAVNILGASTVLLHHRFSAVTRVVEVEDRIIESAL